MDVQILAHALDGVAHNLQSGLNRPIYDLQEVARVLRLPKEERVHRTEVLELIKEAKDSIDNLSQSLSSIHWYASLEFEEPPALVPLEQTVPENLDEIPF